MNQDKSRGSGSRPSPANRSLPTNPPLSPKQEAKTDQKPAGGAFPIVGMGASAGGLEAFEKFFTHLPESTIMSSWQAPRRRLPKRPSGNVMPLSAILPTASRRNRNCI